MQNETLPERIDTFVKPYMVNDRTYSTCDASAMALLNEAASVIRRLEGDRDAAWKMARAAAEGHDRLRLEFSEQGQREAGMVRELESLRAPVKLAESDRDLHKQEIAAVRGAPSTISKLKAERDAFAEAATVALADADLARAEQKDLRDHLAAAEQRIREMKEALAIGARRREALEAEVQAFVNRFASIAQGPAQLEPPVVHHEPGSSGEHPVGTRVHFSRGLENWDWRFASKPDASEMGPDLIEGPMPWTRLDVPGSYVFVAKNRTGQKRYTVIRAVVAAPKPVNAGAVDPVAGP